VAPAVTIAGELRALAQPAGQDGARAMEFFVFKNRVGETGSVPLRFIPGAGLFEESKPLP